jgi:hypothetical protein
LNDLVASWPTTYTLDGTKGVGTWVEVVGVTRRGDVFELRGGAPRGARQHVERVRVAPDGRLSDADRSTLTVPAPRGFLATASLVAAARQGIDLGEAPVVTYANRDVVCVPAGALRSLQGDHQPCVDVDTGAVLAHRHTGSGRFDGPTLDPWSIDIDAGARPRS